MDGQEKGAGKKRSKAYRIQRKYLGKVTFEEAVARVAKVYMERQEERRPVKP